MSPLLASMVLIFLQDTTPQQYRRSGLNFWCGPYVWGGPYSSDRNSLLRQPPSARRRAQPLGQLHYAIRYLGFDIRDVQSPEDIVAAEWLVFPGVGAFGSAMDVLNRMGMADALREYIQRDRPFLGICLGLQLLFDSSEENGPGKLFSTPLRLRLAY
jgi:hypothetical protein